MTTSPESKLLPCPFCGGAPLSEIMDRHHLISCNDEECYAHPVVIVGKTEAIALSRWNKRAPDGAELGRQFSQALNHYLAENAPPRLPVLPLEVILSEENDRLIEALKTINRIASPNPERTFDTAISNLSIIADLARAALAKAEGR